ncbi:MAG TPA: hypothetical protein DCR44_03800 [Acholeplasmatales bacterium]|nr:MAG: hypothetical protein A2Y16_01445 [Tenericutes bacterium GWF2_57_13]HAQ56507.1 hypothetical protein [Acholeplasmatales bacterium]
MKEFDLKSDMPTTFVAVMRLKNYIKLSRSTEKVIKVIHGYGSSGVGGKIRVAVRETLDEMLSMRQIKAFIPGEAISTPMGFDDVIRLYRPLIGRDPDFRKGNDGITYIVL